MEDKTTDGEFFGNMWWVPNGIGTRTATPEECAAEIKRLRAEIADLERAGARMDSFIRGSAENVR